MSEFAHMSLSSPHLIATSWVRSLPGTSQAQQGRISDRTCAIKYRSQHRSSRLLINEWLGSNLLRALAFPAAEAACVDLGIDYRQNGGLAHMTIGTLCDFVPRTGHLASFYPDVPPNRTLYDFLPDAFLQRVSNLTS